MSIKATRKKSGSIISVIDKAPGMNNYWLGRGGDQQQVEAVDSGDPCCDRNEQQVELSST